MIQSNIADVRLLKAANHLKRIRDVVKNVLITDHNITDPEEYLNDHKVIIPLIAYRPQLEIEYEIVFRDEEVRLRPSLNSTKNFPTSSLILPNLFSMELDIITDNFVSSTMVEDIDYINISLNLVTDKMVTDAVNSCRSSKDIFAEVVKANESIVPEEEEIIDVESDMDEDEMAIMEQINEEE